jgi:hypothetical protein
MAAEGDGVMRNILATLLLIVSIPASADTFDYVGAFATQAAAIADPVYGAYYHPATSDSPGGWDQSRTIPGVAVTVLNTGVTMTCTNDDGSTYSCVGPNQLYDAQWRIVVSLPARNPTLDASAATELVADRDVAAAGGQNYILYATDSPTTLATLELSPVPLGSHYPFGTTPP